MIIKRMLTIAMIMITTMIMKIDILIIIMVMQVDSLCDMNMRESDMTMMMTIVKLILQDVI